MYLKKLEVIGFKSFGDPTTVVFQPGITAIVGPNGCGKSNIVDAILWTLGEQSTKTLRSERMEDVIFNGTETRKPLGLCEAILTIGDVSGEIPGQFGDFQEIAISRRLFRTGESEYLINKVPCRLKDIRDLLIDTGAGHKGHTIIEQGKVDQLLNASPMDRRELIEETAGITKYKLRKAEAERKLESTRQNLLRVTDIISEVRRQINALDRQVKKTQTYRALQDETRQLELRLLASEVRTQQNSLSELSREMNDLHSGEAFHRAELGRVETEITSLKTGAGQKETALASLRQSVHDVQMMIQRQENRIELLQSRIQSWEEQRTKLLQEQSRIEQSLSETGKLLEAAQKQQTEIASTQTERKNRLNAQEAALHHDDAELSRHEVTLEENKNRQFEAMANLTEIKNQRASLDSRKKEILRVQEKSRSEFLSVEQQLDQTQQALQQGEVLLTVLTERLAGQEGLRSFLEETLGQKQNALQRQAEEILGIREKITLSQARLASLEENEKSLTSSQAGIRNLITQQPDSHHRLHGIAADLFEISRAHEPAIEAVLAEQLQGLLIEDHATIREILQQLKSGPLGRGLFIPRSPRPDKTRPAFPTTEDYPGVIGPALEQVTAKHGYEAVAQVLFGHILLVRDLDAAFTLWNGNRIDYTIVTLDGEVLEPSGLLWGGQSTGSSLGLLKTRRQIQEVGKEIHSHESRLTQVESVRSALATEIDQLTREQQDLMEQHQALDREVSDQRQKTALMSADRDRLEERRGLLRAEHDQETLELGSVEENLNRTQQQLETLQQDQARIDTELDRLQQMHRDLSEKRELLRSEVTQLKIDVSSLVQQEEALSKEKIRLVNEQAALRDQKQLTATGMLNLESKSHAGYQDVRVTEGELCGLADQLTEALSRLSSQTESYTTELNQIKQVETRQSEVRTELTRLEKHLQEREIQRAEIKLRLTHLIEQASAQYQISLEEMSDPVEPISDDPTREKMNTRLSELRAKLDQLGPVNLAAIDEYKELEERHRFLTTQEADLKQSVDDLHVAISKISRTTTEMFLSAYSELRLKFQEVFQKFFEGGQADLLLLDENQPLDSGIEIVAQPPGKRLRSISLLSGGEKALTAIALLFSSFLIHPSPFCILDEIDAPLDDENIRRFLKVLRKMLNHSQFLIITHNKRTMEQADVLYGVTMEEAGVSKLVSVKVASNGNGRVPTPPTSVEERPSPTAMA